MKIRIYAAPAVKGLKVQRPIPLKCIDVYIQAKGADKHSYFWFSIQKLKQLRSTSPQLQAVGGDTGLRVKYEILT